MYTCVEWEVSWLLNEILCNFLQTSEMVETLLYKPYCLYNSSTGIFALKASRQLRGLADTLNLSCVSLREWGNSFQGLMAKASFMSHLGKDFILLYCHVLFWSKIRTPFPPLSRWYGCSQMKFTGDSIFTSTKKIISNNLGRQGLWCIHNNKY